MKARELREKTEAELHQQLREIQEELFNLRFQQAAGQLSNPMRIRLLRRDVARIKTVLRERELARARAEGAAG
jgi:large subunit ribosomal protein L29